MASEAQDVNAQKPEELTNSFGHALAPPYWQAAMRRQRSTSTVSYTSSVQQQAMPRRGPRIVTEDRTQEDHADYDSGLWAKQVAVVEYSIVSGNQLGVGAYVVWHCDIDILDGGVLKLRKRYSDFDDLRRRLVQTFPRHDGAIPLLPPKSMISRFRTKFLKTRKNGLEYFLKSVLNCV